MWNAYNEGKDQTNLVEMTNTFGPTSNHVERDKLIATYVLMGFGIATAGLWNKGAQTTILIGSTRFEK